MRLQGAWLAGGGMEMGEAPVVDFHIHVADRGNWYKPALELAMRFNRTNRMGDVYGEDGSISSYKLLKLLDECGVDYAVALGSRTKADSHEFIGRFCAASPRLVPFAIYRPGNVDPPGLEEWVNEYGFRGLKLYPTYDHFYPNDPKLYPIYAKAQELEIPLMFHTGSSVFPGSKMKYGEPLLLDDVAADFPGLNIVLAHSGRGFWYDQAFFLARLHPRVYMEISGLPPKKLLRYFPELEKNADKVIFGSDWPACPGIAYGITEIGRLPLSEEAKAKILGGNAARLLGLGARRGE